MGPCPVLLIKYYDKLRLFVLTGYYYSELAEFIENFFNYLCTAID